LSAIKIDSALLTNYVRKSGIDHTELLAEVAKQVAELDIRVRDVSSSLTDIDFSLRADLKTLHKSILGAHDYYRNEESKTALAAAASEEVRKAEAIVRMREEVAKESAAAQRLWLSSLVSLCGSFVVVIVAMCATFVAVFIVQALAAPTP
jgi:hypothetical protein